MMDFCVRIIDCYNNIDIYPKTTKLEIVGNIMNICFQDGCDHKQVTHYMNLLEDITIKPNISNNEERGLFQQV